MILKAIKEIINKTPRRGLYREGRYGKLTTYIISIYLSSAPCFVAVNLIQKNDYNRMPDKNEGV